MTIKNINQPYYAALMIHGEQIELGRADVGILMNRVIANLRASGEDISHCTIALGVTKAEMSKAIKGGGRAQFAHEGENPESPLYGMTADMVAMIQPMTDETPSPFEGITMSRLITAQESDEYKAYLHMAISPENRVGINEGVIESLRQQWRNAYPDVAVHVPVWKD